VAFFCGRDNELFGSIKCGKILDLAKDLLTSQGGPFPLELVNYLVNYFIVSYLVIKSFKYIINW